MDMRYWLLASVLLVIAAALLYTYLAKKELGFDPIQALPYEAHMMEDEEDLSSLELASSNLQDLESFFAKQEDFDFTPFILKAPTNWEAQGASVIDYDFVKIAMTRFHNEEQKQILFQFAFAGHLEELSPSKRGSLDHFVYQAYTSNHLNLIVWQHNPSTLGMLVGHLAAEDLAHIALDSGSAH